MTNAKIILLDNGSLRPEAILYLREYADQLSQRTGKEVAAVSLLHSSKVDASLTDGEKAKTLKSFLLEDTDTDTTYYRIVPFFIGASRALTEYLPTVIEEVQLTRPNINVTIAPHLAHSLGDMQTLAALLSQQIRTTISTRQLRNPSIALVDHGTPAPEVNAVRNSLTDLVRETLGTEVSDVTACSMERREGAEYDFNEPLLENVLKDQKLNEVVVSLLFLSPGRHAGKDGDIAEICAHAELENENISTHTTALLSHKFGLLDLLILRSEN